MMNGIDSPDDWKHGIILSSKNAFTNSQCLFVEYYDCVNFSGFVLLNALRQSSRDIFGINFDPLNMLDLQDQLAWYCDRKNRNFLIDLWKDSHPNENVPRRELDNFLEDQLSADCLYDFQLDTNVDPLIANLISTGFVKDIRIYVDSDIVPNGLKEGIKSMFGNNVSIVSGRISKALEDTPNDTTYIFSDVNNILELESCGRLDMSAIIIPNDFKYNLADDGKLIINMDMLLESYTFKYGFISLC